MNEFQSLRRISRERLTAAARRWGLIVLAGAVVGGTAAFVVSKAVAPEYKATAQLYLTPASSNTLALQDVVLGQNLARSYVQLATAEVVLAPAMTAIGWPDDVKEFKSRVQVSQLRDTSVITVSFRDTSPERSAAAANAIANSFITQTRQLQSSLQGSTASQLEEQIVAVQADIKTLDGQISALRAEAAATPRPGSSASPRPEIQTQILQLDTSLQGKQQTLAQLLKTRDDMRLAATRADNTVSLWQEATPPTDADTPKIGLNTMLGLLAGLIVSLAVVVIASYLDDRIEELSDLPARLGIPALGQIHLGDNPESITGKLFVRDRPSSPEAEAFRSLRTNLMFANVDKAPRTLLITSARAGEGKSVVSANLALAFAEAGTPTILVDADLRRPSQHRLFRVSAGQGLTSLLTDALSLTSLSNFRVANNLIVIPSGQLPPNPAELLASAKMSTVLDHLARSAPGTLVIVDTSPVLAVADPLALSTKVDGCLLLIDSAKTHTAASHAAIEALRRVRAPLLGGVLNKVSFAHAYYYYDGYYYGVGRQTASSGGRGQVKGNTAP